MPENIQSLDDAVKAMPSDIFNAADKFADKQGDLSFEISSLQNLFAVAWKCMLPSQQLVLIQSDDFATLATGADVPSFSVEKLTADIRLCVDAKESSLKSAGIEVMQNEHEFYCECDEFEYSRHGDRNDAIHAAYETWATQPTKLKKPTCGDSNAVVILVGQKLGLEISLIEQAKHQLAGQSVHPIVAKQLEQEACRLHEQIRPDEERIKKANALAREVYLEYGFQA